MEDNVNTKKNFSMRRMMFSEIFILYIIISIGDAIYLMGKIPFFVTRYLPIGLLAVVMTYFLVKSGAKKSLKSEKEGFIKKVFIIPAIITAIIFIYGVISVYQNLEKLQDKVSTYKSIYSYNNYTDKIDKMIEGAKNDAIRNWGITSMVYLVLAEGTTFIMKNRLDNYLSEDEVNSVYDSENIYQGNNNSENSKDWNNTDNTNNVDDTNDAVNKIKWDL